jgi:hypothetical protein
MALQSLDEAADEADAVLEGEPRIPFSPLAAAGWADPTALDPERTHASRITVQATRRQQGVEERQP